MTIKLTFEQKFDHIFYCLGGKRRALGWKIWDKLEKSFTFFKRI